MARGGASLPSRLTRARASLPGARAGRPTSLAYDSAELRLRVWQGQGRRVRRAQIGQVHEEDAALWQEGQWIEGCCVPDPQHNRRTTSRESQAQPSTSKTAGSMLAPDPAVPQLKLAVGGASGTCFNILFAMACTRGPGGMGCMCGTLRRGGELAVAWFGSVSSMLAPARWKHAQQQCLAALVWPA